VDHKNLVMENNKKIKRNIYIWIEQKKNKTKTKTPFEYV
jgi:hypothetical protein